jgi:hypothetical protein
MPQFCKRVPSHLSFSSSRGKAQTKSNLHLFATNMTFSQIGFSYKPKAKS